MNRRKIGGDEPFITINTMLEVCMEMMENPDPFIEEIAQEFLAKNQKVFEDFATHLQTSPGSQTCRSAILFAYALVVHQYRRDQDVK